MRLSRVLADQALLVDYVHGAVLFRIDQTKHLQCFSPSFKLVEWCEIREGKS